MDADERAALQDCLTGEIQSSLDEDAVAELKATIHDYENRRTFFIHKDDMIFGTVAVKTSNGSFWTTGRGKHELSDITKVNSVDHEQRIVKTEIGKASLNAPLLHHLLYGLPFEVHKVVHGHFQYPGLPLLPYATPGTVRDSIRKVTGSFNIANHGCFLLLDEKDQVL